MPEQNDSILIVGTGALATYFAFRLASVGIDVSMLGSWPEGLAGLQRNGVRLEGAGRARVRATDDPLKCRGARQALVLVKAPQTVRAAHQLGDCLSPDGIAVTLQNGLGNDVQLARLLGAKRVGRGVTTLGATLLGPGRVRLGGAGNITLEEGARLAGLEKMLRVAGLAVELVPSIESAVWGKLVINAAINPLTALLRVKNGDLLRSAATRSLMTELAQEAAAVANRQGVTLPFQDTAKAVAGVAHRTAANQSSMLSDVLRGAETEIEAINGAIVRLAREQDLPVPANRVVWTLVKALPVRGKMS